MGGVQMFYFKNSEMTRDADKIAGAVREFNAALGNAAEQLKSFKIDCGDIPENGQVDPAVIKSLSEVSALPYSEWSKDLIKAAQPLVNILYPGNGGDKPVS